MIVTGFLTRFAALGIFGLFSVIALKFHSDNGFFMNWTGSQKGEGIEYFIMVLGLSLILVFSGGGKASVDAALLNNKKLSLA
jgi:putative oxidoreductase